VKLTTDLQPVPRPRKLGSTHPLPHTPSWYSALLVKYRNNNNNNNNIIIIIIITIKFLKLLIFPVAVK
jgi:hypothetical protein